LTGLQESNDARVKLQRHTGVCESSKAFHRLRIRNICPREFLVLQIPIPVVSPFFVFCVTLFVRLHPKFLTEKVGRRAHRTLSAFGALASEAVLRTWSIQFPWLDQPDFYRCGLPARTLAAHFVRTILPKFVHMQKLLAGFGNPCDVPCRSSGITRSPHNENKEKKEGENMTATDTKKATVATSQTIDEVFHEAMRSYHNFVFK
jgi:hypothetical protein